MRCKVFGCKGLHKDWFGLERRASGYLLLLLLATICLRVLGGFEFDVV